MSPWASSRGGVDSRLSSFSKRRWKNRSSLSDSPNTVLSPESSGTEASSVSSEETPGLNRDPKITPKMRELEVDAACFEPINSNTWTVSTDKPSDLLVEVNGISFHLHKLPILSRSALLNRLATKFDAAETAHVNLGSIPGGSDAFAIAAKFCYGIDVELTPANVAGLRCVSEFLEMTEELEEGNVGIKAEAYLNSVVLNAWQESLAALQSCELLLPWSETLQITQRCSESIARKACIDPRNVRWSSSGAGARRGVNMKTSEDWWYEDISLLSLYCFDKVISAMRQNIMNPVLVGGALELYARKSLPGVFKLSAENSPKASPSGVNSPAGDASPVHELSSPDPTSRLHDVIVEQNKNRFLIEKIVSMLPQQKDAMVCSFFLRMLRAANMFNCSAECRTELEKKAGQQLDQASSSDLLIPSFSHTSEYLYDVDLVSRLLEHFLGQEQGLGAGLKTKFFTRRNFGALFAGASSAKQAQGVPSARAKIVAKLLDSYLAEVARDSKLPLQKFYSLAEAVPLSYRVSDDGLYRAIDTFLKIHSHLTDLEKKKLCRILDSQRLSIAACMHAAQNERLPLRIVVQVLFGEQLKLRDVITGISESVLENRATADAGFQPRQCVHNDSPDSVGSQQEMLETTNQMEIRALQHELSTMRIKYTELEKNHSTMMAMMEKLSRSRRNSSSWINPWKKSSKGESPCKDTARKEDLESSTSTTGRTRTTNAHRWRNSIS